MSKNEYEETRHSRDREFTVVLEGLRGQFRIFGEGLQDAQRKLERLDDIDERLKHVESDVSVIKVVIPTLATKKDLGIVKSDLADVKSILPTLATKKDLGIVKSDLADVKSILPTLATKKDVREIHDRLSTLESTH